MQACKQALWHALLAMALDSMPLLALALASHRILVGVSARCQ